MEENLRIALAESDNLIAHLRAAHKAACNVGRPEGMSLGDKAVSVLVNGLIEKAASIRSALAMIV